MSKEQFFYLGAILGMILMKLIPSITWFIIASYAVVFTIYSHEKLYDKVISIVLPTLIIVGLVEICTGYKPTVFSIVLTIWLFILWIYNSSKYNGHLTIDEDDITLFPPEQIHI